MGLMEVPALLITDEAVAARYLAWEVDAVREFTSVHEVEFSGD